MIPEFGHFALFLALALSMALTCLPALGVYRGNRVLMASASSLAAGVFVFLLISFICLLIAFLQDDFSVQYVANNSKILQQRVQI